MCFTLKIEIANISSEGVDKNGTYFSKRFLVGGGNFWTAV